MAQAWDTGKKSVWPQLIHAADNWLIAYPIFFKVNKAVISFNPQLRTCN